MWGDFSMKNTFGKRQGSTDTVGGVILLDGSVQIYWQNVWRVRGEGFVAAAILCTCSPEGKGTLTVSVFAANKQSKYRSIFRKTSPISDNLAQEILSCAYHQDWETLTVIEFLSKAVAEAWQWDFVDLSIVLVDIVEKRLHSLFSEDVEEWWLGVLKTREQLAKMVT